MPKFYPQTLPMCFSPLQQGACSVPRARLLMFEMASLTLCPTFLPLLARHYNSAVVLGTLSLSTPPLSHYGFLRYKLKVEGGREEVYLQVDQPILSDAPVAGTSCPNFYFTGGWVCKDELQHEDQAACSNSRENVQC